MMMPRRFRNVFLVLLCMLGTLEVEAASARSVRRATQLLSGRMPTDAELASATTTDAGYRELVRSLVMGDQFYDAALRYHERVLGVGLPEEYLKELERDDIDGKAQKVAKLTCKRSTNNRLYCAWRNADKKTTSTCQAADQHPVAPFWKNGLVLWVCPSVSHACGADLSKCSIEFPDNAAEARYSEIGTTDVFDSRRSMLKSLSRQAAGIATAVAVANYPYTKIMAPGLTAVDGILSVFLQQSFQFDVTKVHANESLLQQIKAIPASQSRFQLIYTGNAYETAGVLSTFGWLRRYEKNRTRANQLYERLLCRKFTSELPRVFPQDPGNLRTTPGCSGCHATLDPLADFFGVWGEGGGLYSGLSSARDASFIGKSGTSLADLANIITADEAFAACTVNHVFEYLMGRKFRIAEANLRQSLTDYFIGSNFSFRELMYAVATHPGFTVNSRSDANITDPLEQPALGKVPEPTLPVCSKTIDFNADIAPLISACTSCHKSGAPRQALETSAQWKTWGSQAVSMISIGQMPPGMQGAPAAGSAMYNLKEAVRCWLTQNP
ncbi:MAG: hypothetical protein RI953_2797 [Pseudomonadota bacterium]|jgi:hypothetical protein